MLKLCGVILTIGVVAVMVTTQPAAVLGGLGEFESITTSWSNGVTTTTICNMKGCNTTTSNKTPQTVSDYFNRGSNDCTSYCVFTTNCTPKGCTTTVNKRPQTILNYILSLI